MLQIYSWMPITLGLKGIELIIYAIIYQETRIAKEPKIILHSEFAKWCNCSKKSSERNINILVQKKYITKDYVYIDGVMYCAYKCTFYKD